MAGLATCAPGGNHVFKLLVDVGAVLFKDHDAQGAVMGGDTRGPGHGGVELLVDDVLHHGVDRRTVDEAHGPRADASAVPGVVLWWKNNPVIQFELAESHPEIVQGTVACREFRAWQKLGQVDIQTFISFALGRFPLPPPLSPNPLLRFENHLLVKCVRPLSCFGADQQPLVGDFAGVIEIKKQRRGPQGELERAFALITPGSSFLWAGDVDEQVYVLLLKL